MISIFPSGRGRIGIHKRLKISRANAHAGSSPAVRTKIAMRHAVCRVSFGLPAWAESVSKGDFPVYSSEAEIAPAMSAVKAYGKVALNKLKSCKMWMAGLPIKRLKHLDGWSWGGT